MTKSIHTAEHRVLVTMLRDLRVRAGMTQTEVAKRLGKPQSFVAKYEAGERRLDIIELIAVLRAMGESPVAFVGYLCDAV